jgi:acetyl esterase
MNAPISDRARSLRRTLGARGVDLGYQALARVGRRTPAASPARHGVRVQRDLAYRDTGLAAHRLDIYRPADAEGPLPVVFYVHGGGFRALSKDTHWLMGLAYARRGYLVVNINYRLAPANRWPAAHEDAAAALAWLAREADALGADLGRLFLAGESAGANLITALAMALSYPDEAPWAGELEGLPLAPSGVLAYCGIFQVSDPGRHLRRWEGKGRPLNWFVSDRLVEVQENYLQGAHGPGTLADPLLVARRLGTPRTALPPFFLPVGTADPLLLDTRELADALRRLGAVAEDRYYPGELHAFQALIWRRQARACWRHSFDFLERCLASRAAG